MEDQFWNGAVGRARELSCARATVARVCTVVLLLAFPAAAQTQKPKEELTDLSLEQLMDVKVYAASRHDQALRNVPASATIVTRAEIEQFGYRNLADILQNVSGFYVTYDRNYSYIGARGFGRPGDYNTRVLLLIDGHRLNDNVYNEALVGNEFPLDIGLVDRVEIIRGPGSSIYGTNAFFAVINVITRASVGTGEAAGEVGSYGTVRGRITGELTTSGSMTLFSASGLSSRGQDLFYPEFDAPETNDGIAEDADFERSRSAFLKYERGALRIEGLYSSREKGIPTGSYGTVFNDRRNASTDATSYLEASWRRDLTGSSALEARAHVNETTYDGRYVYDYPPVTVNRDQTRGRWWGSEIVFRSTKFARQTVVAGAEFEDSVQQDQANYDEEPRVVYLDERRSSTRWALYAQDEIRLSDAVLLDVGIRHDHENFGKHVSPRVALIVNGQSTTLKFLYGNAFRAPNQYELFYHSEVPVQLANPGLQPETINTYEIAADHRIGDKVELKGSAFFYRISSLISLTEQDGALHFQNADRAESRGVETALVWHPAHEVTAAASLTIQRTRGEGGAQLTNSPDQLARASVRFPLFGPASAGLVVRYMGSRLTLAGERAAAHTLFDATLLARNIGSRFSAVAAITNVFDKQYADPGSAEHAQDVIPQDGRAYRLNLTYRF